MLYDKSRTILRLINGRKSVRVCRCKHMCVRVITASYHRITCGRFYSMLFHMCRTLARYQNASALVNLLFLHVRHLQEVLGWLKWYWKEGWETKHWVVIGYLASSQGNGLKGWRFPLFLSVCPLKGQKTQTQSLRGKNRTTPPTSHHLSTFL